MNLKYIGEALALLGIAYSIYRWIVRNAPESDVRSHGLHEVDLVRLDTLFGGSSSGARSEPGRSRSRTQSGTTVGGEPASDPPSDPVTLDEAAAMFGVSRDALVRMGPRERTLLLSAYQTARAAQRRSGPADADQPS